MRKFCNRKDWTQANCRISCETTITSLQVNALKLIKVLQNFYVRHLHKGEFSSEWQHFFLGACSTPRWIQNISWRIISNFTKMCLFTQKFCNVVICQKNISPNKNKHNVSRNSIICFNIVSSNEKTLNFFFSFKEKSLL